MQNILQCLTYYLSIVFVMSLKISCGIISTKTEQAEEND